MATVTLRALSNPDVSYKAGDLTQLYPDDWNLVKGAIDDGTYGVNTSDLSIAGTETIDGSRTGKFVQLEPDADGTRQCGTASKRWASVRAVTFYGAGSGLTGVLLLSGGTMSGAIDMGSNKITSLATCTASGDAAPKSYVDGVTTGAAPTARGDIITANATPAWQRLALGSTSYYLRSDGTDALWAALAAADLTGSVAAANGGTGQTSYTVGDLLYASTSSAISKLAAVATGSVLYSQGTGTAPAYQVLNEITDTILSTTTGVDLNVTTKTTLYTVPAGKTCYVTKIVVRDASAAITTADFTCGYNALADDVVDFSVPSAVVDGTIYAHRPITDGKEGAAAAVLGLKCSIAEGSACTVTVDVIGYLV